MLRNAKNTVLLFYRVSVPNKRFLGTIGRHYTRQFDILVAEHAGQGVLVVPNVLFPRKIEIVLLRDAQIIVLWKWGQIFVPRFVWIVFLRFTAVVASFKDVYRRRRRSHNGGTITITVMVLTSASTTTVRMATK